MAHQAGDLAPQRFLVDGLYFALFDHHASIDDYALNAAAGLGVDELPGGAVVGQIRDVVEIDENQIGAVTGADGAKLALKPRGARVAESGMAQHLVRETGTRLRLAHGCEQTEHFHGLEYALHVAAAAIVAAQPQAHAGFAQVADRCNAAFELEIAEMI